MNITKRIFIMLDDVCIYLLEGAGTEKYKRATSEQAAECIKKMKDSHAKTMIEAETDFDAIYNKENK